MKCLAEGFEPVYDKNSRLLILGSFPSVKSRAINFYYGNPQNRFWKTLSEYFKEVIPETPQLKRAFVLRHNIALWDVVTSCEIEGSSDASITNEKIADIEKLMGQSNIKVIFCNGNKAYSLFAAHFPQYLGVAKKLTSTSPANPRFTKEEWFSAFKEINL